MEESTSKVLLFPYEAPRNALESVLREGAQKLLIEAIEAEVAEFLEARKDRVDGQGRRQVVRNGYLPSREIQTPLGDLTVRQGRVRDRRAAEQREVFTSKILPPYLRRTRSLEDLIPWLYLKGVSTGEFGEALQALLGAEAKGLSASTITRLKGVWQQEYEAWSRRSLQCRRYVYLWADGIHFNVRLESPESRKQCILVLIGATESGSKELVAIQDGFKESTESWREVLVDLQQRGLTSEPAVIVGDGALGLWAAVREVWPSSRQQRCWVHKTVNVLAGLPDSVQERAKSHLHDIWQAETRASAEKAFDDFVALYQLKHPKAVAKLTKDREELLTFYDFPAEHWVHLRTTNPIESTFATVRLRTNKTKGCGSRLATLSMVFRLGATAQKKWRSLNGANRLKEVAAAKKFVDGMKIAAA
jgi:transposase-like protein